jgi:hypothetical protein
VSGNYTYRTYSPAAQLPGGGIYVFKVSASSIVRAYNTLVLGNIGLDGLRNDVATFNGGEFLAYNSLVGGYTAAQLNDGVADDGTRIGVGSNNRDGASFGTSVAEATRLTNLKAFFTAFNALPADSNTGDTHVADWTSSPLWRFSLKVGATGAIDRGSTAYLVDGFTVAGSPALPYQINKDVIGANRIRSDAPDLGAYESGFMIIEVDSP